MKEKREAIKPFIQLIFCTSIQLSFMVDVKHLFNIYSLLSGLLFRRRSIHHLKRVYLMFHSGFPALQVNLVNFVLQKEYLLCVYLEISSKYIKPFRYICIRLRASRSVIWGLAGWLLWWCWDAIQSWWYVSLCGNLDFYVHILKNWLINELNTGICLVHLMCKLILQVLEDVFLHPILCADYFIFYSSQMYVLICVFVFVSFPFSACLYLFI